MWLLEILVTALLIFFFGGGGGRGLDEMTFWLVHGRYSSPEQQAVKLTFFASCGGLYFTGLP